MVSCNICIYWTTEFGCDHHQTPEQKENREVSNIVKYANGRDGIKETSDFIAGIKITLKYLKK